MLIITRFCTGRAFLLLLCNLNAPPKACRFSKSLTQKYFRVWLGKCRRLTFLESAPKCLISDSCYNVSVPGLPKNPPACLNCASNVRRFVCFTTLRGEKDIERFLLFVQQEVISRYLTKRLWIYARRSCIVIKNNWNYHYTTLIVTKKKVYFLPAFVLFFMGTFWCMW